MATPMGHEMARYRTLNEESMTLRAAILRNVQTVAHSLAGSRRCHACLRKALSGTAEISLATARTAPTLTPRRCGP